ncbi:hypothetical protein JRO89_XS05G0231100 [Xanthoceras sorbifolium]|uniref:Bet v I/Major latex protein domain-containing protein n=1 Tax=Xanthoceras sorbifolium TaxID=99658 RepID=A0ABQ8I2X1_9ROSI|nr:hypothetical protein JRO89_XS05G0231100 [Xanthoceras sorbifolium]
MSLAGKVEVDVELKASGDQFYKITKCLMPPVKYRQLIFTKVLNKDEGGLVKLSLEYEKHKATDEPPYQYLDFVAGLIKDIDAHLVKAA